MARSTDAVAHPGIEELNAGLDYIRRSPGRNRHPPQGRAAAGGGPAQNRRRGQARRRRWPHRRQLEGPRQHQYRGRQREPGGADNDHQLPRAPPDGPIRRSLAARRRPARDRHRHERGESAAGDAARDRIGGARNLRRAPHRLRKVRPPVRERRAQVRQHPDRDEACGSGAQTPASCSRGRSGAGDVVAKVAP